MNVAFLVGEFPLLSETFVLNQITGLIDRGHTVDIFSERQSQDRAAHPDVARYKLLESTFYESLPAGYVARLAGLPSRLQLWRREGLATRVRALNAIRWGLQAGSLRLLYAVSPFFERPTSYDVMVAHFGANGVRGAYLRHLGVTRAKLVTVFHGVDLTAYPRQFKPGLYTLLWQTGELFLPISSRWNDRLAELGCPQDKIHVHRMGIDCRQFLVSRRCARRRSP